jgi:hypothetical protein
MPDQELLDDFLDALEAAGSPARNKVLRETLSCQEVQYVEVKAERSFCVPWLSGKEQLQRSSRDSGLVSDQLLPVVAATLRSSAADLDLQKAD